MMATYEATSADPAADGASSDRLSSFLEVDPGVSSGSSDRLSAFMTPVPGVTAGRSSRLSTFLTPDSSADVGESSRLSTFLTPALSADAGRTSRLSEFVTTSVGVEYGMLIPPGYHPVDVVVKDVETEERLSNLKYLMGRGRLSLVSEVDEHAEAKLWLRAADYEDFLGIAARAGGESADVDYAWYSSTERQPTVNPLKDETATIWLKRAELKGLWGGVGADFGGQLGGTR